VIFTVYLLGIKAAPHSSLSTPWNCYFYHGLYGLRPALPAASKNSVLSVSVRLQKRLQPKSLSDPPKYLRSFQFAMGTIQCVTFISCFVILHKMSRNRYLKKKFAFSLDFSFSLDCNRKHKNF